MKKKVIALLGLVLFCSHDMYLKMDTYFVEPNQQAIINLFNGTFDKSENVIDRDRMIDASLLGNAKRYEITEDQWSERDSITVLSFKTGEEGTWVAGVSTKPRSIKMAAEAFNDYLRHDGVLDMLTWRSENAAMAKDAVEKYSKHVKAIFQVGDASSADWSTPLDYPIEFVPMENPYDKHTGDALKLKLLLKGAPLTNQLVYADYRTTANRHTHTNAEEAHSHGNGEEHTHESDEKSHSHDTTTASDQPHSHDGGEKHTHDDETHSHESAETGTDTHSHDDGEEHSHETEAGEPEEDHQHTSGQQLRTDQNGVLTLQLDADGIWYLRTIHLVETEEAGFTHESNWATLTFEVVHGHGDEGDAAGHSHIVEDGIPSYVFWIGSLVVLGGLFFWFSRKK